MTKAELVEEVARVSEFTKKHSEVIVNTVFDSIIDALRKDEKIELRGFGSFRIRQRRSRQGRSPGQADPVLQARQGVEGIDQQLGAVLRACGFLRHLDRRGALRVRPPSHGQALQPLAPPLYTGGGARARSELRILSGRAEGE